MFSHYAPWAYGFTPVEIYTLNQETCTVGRRKGVLYHVSFLRNECAEKTKVHYLFDCNCNTETARIDVQLRTEGNKARELIEKS
jgi:hypothetical protein